jgi:hypothetical protein
MRLAWHSVLLGEPRLRQFKRGEESPGNVKLSDCGGGHKKLAKYLAKYLGKTFEETRGTRAKRFATSKGIEQPLVECGRMPPQIRHGVEVLFLRGQLEGEGWKVSGIFESSLPNGERLIWMQATRRGSS